MKANELNGYPKHLLVECFNNERGQKVTIPLTASWPEEVDERLNYKLGQKQYHHFISETEGNFQTRILERV